MRLFLRRVERTIRPMLAVCRDGVVEPVLVSCPADIFAKDALGKTYADSEGAYRWITVHPHGSEEGQPVKIRESRTHRGTWHVVGGAGGKLNYLTLHNVKSPEEYKQIAADKRRVRKEAEKAKRETEKRQREMLTPEEREVARSIETAKKEEKQQQAEELEAMRRELIADLAKELGWKDDEWQFDATRERLEAAGADEKRIAQLEQAHLKRVLTKAKAAVAETKRQLLMDHEMRAAADLGELPLKSDDPGVVALADLDPDKINRGLGYQKDVTKASDAEITRQLAAADAERLERELNAARADVQDELDQPRVARIEQELRVATLLRDNADKTPIELQARDAELTQQIEAVKAEKAEHEKLAKAAREERPEGEQGEHLDRANEYLDMATLDAERIKQLTRQREDVAILQGEQSGAVKAEKKELAAKRQADREREIVEEGGSVAFYRAFKEMLQGALADYRAEIASYRASGALRAPEVEVAPVRDAAAAMRVLRKAKELEQIEKVEKLAQQSEAPIDEKLFGKALFVETRPAKLDAKIKRDLDNSIAEQRTRAFLREVESGEQRHALLDLTETQRRESLERHISAGSYNAVNNASLTILDQGVISREVADVLGAAGSAQLLARVIQQRKSPEELEAIREGLGGYHLANHLRASEEAVRTARDLYDQAHEIELGAAANPMELAGLQEANAKRRQLLLQAREVLGQTLGEQEFNAQLVAAMRAKPVDEVNVNLGPIAPDSAIRQARAIGLGREDYELDTDGTNRFLKVKASGLDRIAEAMDPAEQAMRDEIMAIKKGERDQEGWIPPGMVTRPASSFTDPRLTAESIGAHQQAARPMSQWGSGGVDVRRDVEDHIGARIADGEDPNDILPSMLGNLSSVPPGQREAVVQALDEIMPTQVEVNGKRKCVKADYHQETLNKLAEQYLQREYASTPEVASFHAQGLKLGTPEETKKTTEAMYLALAKDPRASVGFKTIGELTSQDQAALRHYFSTEVAKPDAAGLDKKRLDEELAKIGPEPEKESVGLFGKQTNPMWAEWNQKRQALISQAQDSTPSWTEYVEMHHGTRGAYEALQDRLKHGFLERFTKSYAAVHGEPLRVGKRSIRNAERHLSFVDPAERERLLTEERKMNDLARNRVRGRYAEGSIKEKVDRILQMQEIERQNQLGLFGVAEPKQPAELKVAAGERLSIGEHAENQIRSLIGNVASSVRPGDKPVDLFPNFSMSGSATINGAKVPLVMQQRIVKAILARKRMVVAAGVGTGKTPIAIGAFTAAASDPKTGVKRGLFLVPSAIQAQYGGEIARFAEPGRFNWHARPGADYAERIRAHADPDTHMMVTTHEGFRDDMLKLMGMSGEKFMGMTRKERAKAIRAAWDKAGINYQATFIDEGHKAKKRAGQEESILSALLMAAADNTSHYASLTADPVVNDASEARDMLDRLHPDGRYSDEAAWHRRYGLNTTASQDALRREIQGSVFAASVPPPIKAQHAVEAVKLHPDQQKDYDRVNELYQKARVGRARGTIDVEAIKELSPTSFEGVDAGQHEEVARRLSDNLGIIRDAALHRAINLAPAERNAKIQAIVEKLKTHPVKDKPVVIFAHNLAAVGHLEKALTEAGHRVASLTGEHSSKEKDLRRTKFAPPKGVAPEADVLVLSDAGATGLNLQRGQTLIQYDTPMTAMGHEQRNGRIHRLGQMQDVDLVDMVADTPYEHLARTRLSRKLDLRGIFSTDASAAMDDSDLGAHIARARQAKMELEESRSTKLAA